MILYCLFQGETAPGTRKGTCAMHLRDIGEVWRWLLVVGNTSSNIVAENFLSGHHVTISVRNEDELDLKMILDKVSKVSSSAYNFREKPQGA